MASVLSQHEHCAYYETYCCDDSQQVVNQGTISLVAQSLFHTNRRGSLLPRDLLELRGDCFGKVGKNDSEDLAAMSFLADSTLAKRVRKEEQTVRIVKLDCLSVSVS